MWRVLCAEKLERFLLLGAEPLIKECGINVREPDILKIYKREILLLSKKR